MGDVFQIPDKCLKLHNNTRFNCSCINEQDIKSFRSQLYQSIEKSDQIKVLSQCISTVAPKRRTGTLTVVRVMQVYYFFPKDDSEKIPICRDMFFAITGLGRSRVKNIVNKLYKQELLAHGDGERLLQKTDNNSRKSVKTIEKEKTLKLLITEKKEKMLQMEKGTYEKFSRAINHRNNPEAEQSDDESHASSENYQDYEEFEETSQLSEEILEEKTILNLEAFEICRICLQNDRNLFPLFECLENEENPYAELINFGMSIEVKKTDFL